jgi:hypothetical protein
MFDAIVNGGIVPNCYNPISRRMALMGEFSGRPEFMGSKYLGAPQLLPLVRLPAPEPSELSRCAANSYVTQNDLVIDSSCASKTCFNLNGMNVHQQLPDRIAFDPKLKLWCVK